MEYQIFHKIRNWTKIPYFLRFLLAILLIIIWFLASFIPIIPWIIFVVSWIILLLPANKLKHLIKIRKWLVYMIQNIREKRMVKHKVLDIIIHSKDLVWIKKEWFFERLIKKFKKNAD